MHISQVTGQTRSYKLWFVGLFVVCAIYIAVTSFRSSFSLTPDYCRRNLPGALIVGAPKCGTAALATFLSFHPDIAINGRKELNFFSDNYDKGFQWYQKQMPCSVPGQMTVERSSNYFHKAGVPDRVKLMSSNTKLILIVCEPVRRMVSAFSMHMAHGKLASNTTFGEYFFTVNGNNLKVRKNKYLDPSKYSEHLPLWLKLFSDKQMYIVNGDKLSLEPWVELSGVEEFLGVRRYLERKNFIFNETKGFFCFKQQPEGVQTVKDETTIGKNTARCLGEGKGRKHVEVQDVYTKLLKHYLRPYNEKFYKRSGRRFNW